MLRFAFGMVYIRAVNSLDEAKKIDRSKTREIDLAGDAILGFNVVDIIAMIKFIYYVLFTPSYKNIYYRGFFG